jgi:hypothetical protein
MSLLLSTLLSLLPVTVQEKVKGREQNTERKEKRVNQRL